MHQASLPHAQTYRTAEPAILYFGTPVVLISSANEDGTFNLAPMSSAFWLGWHCVLGLATASKTTENLKRTGECVLNLPSVEQVDAVDRLALTTGSDPAPPGKVGRGYRFEGRKFELAELTPVAFETVAPPRALECPVHLEATVEHWGNLAENDEAVRGRSVIFEVRIRRVHLAKAILLDGHCDRVNPDRWRPLVMSFQQLYGLAPGQAHASRLSCIPEALYKSPDVDAARAIPNRKQVRRGR